MQDAEDYNFTLTILKKRLTKLNEKSDLGFYMLKRTKNLLSLILEIVTELSKFIDSLEIMKNESDINLVSAQILSELENNYQTFKQSEILVIKRYIERTTVDEKINALEVADSYFEDVKIGHSMILGHSMIKGAGMNPNVRAKIMNRVVGWAQRYGG